MNVPDDLKGMYAEALLYSEKPWYWLQILPSKIISLIERIARLEAENAALKQSCEFALYKSAKSRVFDLEGEVERLNRQLSMCRIAARSYADAIAAGEPYGDEVKSVLVCRQSLDALLAARKGTVS